MKQNQNTRQNRQGRSNQYNNQKRPGKSRHNNNRNQQPNTANRQIDSRGPGGNQRGNAKQLYEKYKLMAQEKRASDRLESESLSQHADHYYRVYAEFAAAEAASQLAREQAKEQAKEQQAKERQAREQAKQAQAEAERRANSSDRESLPNTAGMAEQPPLPISPEQLSEALPKKTSPEKPPRKPRRTIKKKLPEEEDIKAPDSL